MIVKVNVNLRFLDLVLDLVILGAVVICVLVVGGVTAIWTVM